MKKTATHTHPLALCAADLVTLVHDGLISREEARALLGIGPDETAAVSPANLANALASEYAARKNPDTVLVEIPRAFLLEAQSILAFQSPPSRGDRCDTDELSNSSSKKKQGQ